VNIEHPIDLYEIVAKAPADWAERCARYQEALAALERELLEDAARLAQQFAGEFPQDAAAEALCRRIQAAGRGGSPSDATVWQLPGK
jgi:adenylate cyclase